MLNPDYNYNTCILPYDRPAAEKALQRADSPTIKNASDDVCAKHECGDGGTVQTNGYGEGRSPTAYMSSTGHLRPAGRQFLNPGVRDTLVSWNYKCALRSSFQDRVASILLVAWGSCPQSVNLFSSTYYLIAFSQYKYILGLICL